jgi:hypothetical protein
MLAPNNNRGVTYQTGEKNLNNVFEYSVGVVKLAHYCYITFFLWRVIKPIITVNIYKLNIEKTRKMSCLRVFDPPRLAPYRMQCGGLSPNIKSFNNQASAEYKAAIEASGISYELVPPEEHTDAICLKKPFKPSRIIGRSPQRSCPIHANPPMVSTSPTGLTAAPPSLAISGASQLIGVCPCLWTPRLLIKGYVISYHPASKLEIRPGPQNMQCSSCKIWWAEVKAIG